MNRIELLERFLAFLKNHSANPSVPPDPDMALGLFTEGVVRVCLGDNLFPETEDGKRRQILILRLVDGEKSVWKEFLRIIYKNLHKRRDIFDAFVAISPFPDMIVIPFDDIRPHHKVEFNFSELEKALIKKIDERTRGVVAYIEGAALVNLADANIVGVDIMGSG
ncbi:MAG TPA: hypothetical protein VFT82_03770 [Candidatus Paceibacterota bacterium]|nr:hypothetical protein [Candidatus Paceibacterota bacterium]